MIELKCALSYINYVNSVTMVFVCDPLRKYTAPVQVLTHQISEMVGLPYETFGRIDLLPLVNFKVLPSVLGTDTLHHLTDKI